MECCAGFPGSRGRATPHAAQEFTPPVRHCWSLSFSFSEESSEAGNPGAANKACVYSDITWYSGSSWQCLSSEGTDNGSLIETFLRGGLQVEDF